MAFGKNLLRILTFTMISFHLLYSKSNLKLRSSTLKIIPDSIKLELECVMKKNIKLIKIKKFIKNNPYHKYFMHTFANAEQKLILFKNLFFLNMECNYRQKNIKTNITIAKIEIYNHIDILIKKFIRINNLYFIYGAIIYRKLFFFDIKHLHFLIIFISDSNVGYSILYIEKKLLRFYLPEKYDTFIQIGENFLIHFLMNKNLKAYIRNFS